ncbi:MAG: hypothetical protein FWG03_08010 [Clostridiales bacterium]|nr:hypothetical protein [Clostridiales bacterium]
MICLKCDKELVPKKVNLDYLGHRVTQEFLACPVCGNLFIPEDVVAGKMQKVEAQLEDK